MPLSQLIRDSVLADALRFCNCHAKFLRYTEERDGFTLPKDYGLHQSELKSSSKDAIDSCATKFEDLQLTPHPQPEGDLEKAPSKVSKLENIQSPTLEDSLIVDWYSAEDPDNPQNWSFKLKCFVSTLICLMTFASYIGSAIYTPAIPGIQEDLGVSRVYATLGLSVFILGYSTGPLFFAPLSEIPSFGRTSIYVYSMLVSVFFQIPSLLTNNISVLLAMRFCTGFFGSPALALGGASMQDIWPDLQLGYAMCIWDLGAALGPVIGPLLGGFPAEYLNWRWPLYELLIITVVTVIILIIFLPETSSSTLLLRRAERLRKVTGNSKFISLSEYEQSKLSFRALIKEALIRPFQMMLEPEICYINFYVGFTYAVFYLWFEAFPVVYEGIYHFSLSMTGLAFLGLAIGLIICMVLYGLYIHYYMNPRYLSGIPSIPEDRIIIAAFGAPFIPVSLFIFGWTARPDIHWMASIFGTALYSPGIEWLFLGAMTYLAAAYPKYAASVFASNGFVRGCTAAVFPLFAATFYDKVGVGPACSILAGFSILMIPGLWIIYKYGKRLRARSKFAD